MNRKINLQLFAAEANLTKTADLEPALSIDHTSRISRSLTKFREVLGITEMQPMAAGTQIKIYKSEKKNAPAQVGEGETIPLTKIERKLAQTIDLTLAKHRKSTSAESIQKVGYDNAVNKTDEKLISEIQKGINRQNRDATVTRKPYCRCAVRSLTWRRCSGTACSRPSR